MSVKKIGALLNSLLLKAGVKSDDPALISLLSKAELANAEIPVELSDALEQNLLTVDSASANKTVRNTIIAQAMNGIDGELDSLVDELEFDDTVKTTIKGIKGNSHERVRQLKAETKKLIEKVSKQQGKGDVEAANKTIKELNDKLAALNTEKQKQIDELTTSHRSQIKDVKLQSLLHGKNYPNKDLPAEVNVLTAQHLINADLAKKGYKMEIDENGQWTLKTKDGTDVFVDNKQIDYQQYIDAVLAENKFLAVNTPQPGNPTQPIPGTPQNPTNTSVVNEIDAQLAQLK